jgi:N-acetylglutamate synthase-like GNAT family acetyltransferase
MVAVEDGAALGLANLGIRGERGWIGGIGVVPAARRRGVAERLMRALLDEARERGIRAVTLEVLEENDPAYRLYEKLGFEVTRQVEVWSLVQSSDAASAREGDVDVAHTRILAERTAPEPWQRADETLAYLRTLEPGLLGLESGEGAAVIRSAGGQVQLVQIAASAADAKDLLRYAAAAGSVTVLNLPIDEPAAGALRRLGATRVVRQREMALSL